MKNKVPRAIVTQNPLPSPIILETIGIEQEGYQCQTCFVKFALERALTFHRAFENRWILCPMCEKKFLSNKSMKQHFGKKHIMERLHECCFCSKRFRNKYILKDHEVKVHLEIGRLQCGFCGLLVYNKFSLNRHLKICPENRIIS